MHESPDKLDMYYLKTGNGGLRPTQLPCSVNIIKLEKQKKMQNLHFQH